MDGIINVYKEKGFTSHDVVAKLRGILKMKKIGHTGTLDPDATGVLPVCIGKATRLCDMLTEKNKDYEAVIRLGITTDTQDITGNVIMEQPYCGSKEHLCEVISSFQGEIMQVPPMYSAIKVGGKKLYELARQGITIEREPRKCTVYSLDILSVSDDLKKAVIRTKVSKGTYIRTLCDDIGKKLGCGACMEELTRTRAGYFDIDEALKLGEIEELVNQGQIEDKIIAIEDVFDMPCYIVKEEYEKRLRNGNELGADMIYRYERQVSHPFVNSGEEDICVYYTDMSFAAVYRWHKEIGEMGTYKVYKMF